MFRLVKRRFIGLIPYGSLGFIAFFAINLRAQYSIGGKWLVGKLLPHSSYTIPLVTPISGLQVEAEWEIPVERRPIYEKRKKLYTHSYIGASFLAMDMGLKVTGNQYGFGASVGQQRSISESVSVGWKISYGPSYLTQKYDSSTTPINWAIGSHWNYMAILTGETRIKFNEKLGLNLGLNLTHCSNANYKKPNVGLNVLNGSLGLFYIPYSHRQEGKRYYRVKRKYFAYPYSLGVKLAIREHSLEFKQPTAVWILDFNYRVQKDARGYWDCGIELFSDPNYYWDKWGNLNGIQPKDTREVALKLGKVFLFGRLGMRLDLGYYVLKPVHSVKPIFYNGLGCEYRLTQNWVLRNRIKAHLNRADYMEWGLSYIW